MKCSAERTRSKWKSRIRTIIVVNRIRLKPPNALKSGRWGSSDQPSRYGGSLQLFSD